MAQYKAAQVAGAKSGYMSHHGNAVSDDDTVSPTALLALADTLDLLYVPGGTRVQQLWTVNSDLCTSNTLAVKIGYRKVNGGGVLTDDDDYFVAAGATNFQAAVTSQTPTRYIFAPITFNEDVIIFATVTAAATGTAITNGTITTHMVGKAVGVK